MSLKTKKAEIKRLTRQEHEQIQHYIQAMSNAGLAEDKVLQASRKYGQGLRNRRLAMSLYLRPSNHKPSSRV